MKIFPLSLSPDYRSHWSVADAIRELLQNALDDKSSFDYGFPNGSMIIRNNGVSLPTRTLLLGNGDKSDDEDSVGGFGEGYKIALLILTREGYKVTIRNGDKLWTPFYEYSELYESDMLHIREEPLPDNYELTFIIEGVDEALKNEVIDKCLYLQKDLGEVIENEYGRILKDIKGKLYVGGLFVTDTDLDYSYDFHPKYLPLNTDRQSVDSWDLKHRTASIWKATGQNENIAKLVFNKCPDVENLRYSTFESDLTSKCYDIYKEQYGVVPIASDLFESKQMEEEGYSKVAITGNETFTNLVKKSSEYKAHELTPKSIYNDDTPLEVLEDLFLDISGSLTEEEQEQVVTLMDLFKKRGIEWED